MLITAGSTQCTAGFVFDGVEAQAGHVYLSTAAHCVESKGQAVLDADGAAIGTVVALGAAGNDEADDHRDWALVEVPTAAVSRIDPSLVGHPEMPRGGAADAAHVLVGDPVQFSGWGQPWLTASLREQRTGTVMAYAEPRYSVRGPIFFGDSGGPVVDIASGRALGIVSLTIVVGPGPRVAKLYETSGPTPSSIATQAAAAGLKVAVRTIERGKGALPAPAVVTRTPGSRPKAKISFTIDYFLGRKAVRLGGRRLVISAWLRGRKLELTLKRKGKLVSRAAKHVGSVRNARLLIESRTRARSVRGVVRYGSRRVAFRVTGRRIAFVR
jgi:Trypsin-like peptidase domain